MSTTQLNTGTSSTPESQVVKDATLNVLIPAMRVMSRSTGVLHVETKHHQWKILLTGGGIATMEREGYVIPALVAKFASRGVKFARIPEIEVKQANRPYCYSFVSQVYRPLPRKNQAGALGHHQRKLSCPPSRRQIHFYLVSHCRSKRRTALSQHSGLGKGNHA